VVDEDNPGGDSRRNDSQDNRKNEELSNADIKASSLFC
jgi:hypothetical protein